MRFEKAAPSAVKMKSIQLRWRSLMQDKHNVAEMLSQFYNWNVTEL